MGILHGGLDISIIFGFCSGSGLGIWISSRAEKWILTSRGGRKKMKEVGHSAPLFLFSPKVPLLSFEGKKVFSYSSGDHILEEEKRKRIASPWLQSNKHWDSSSYSSIFSYAESQEVGMALACLKCAQGRIVPVHHNTRHKTCGLYYYGT